MATKGVTKLKAKLRAEREGGANSPGLPMFGKLKTPEEAEDMFDHVEGAKEEMATLRGDLARVQTLIAEAEAQNSDRDEVQAELAALKEEAASLEEQIRAIEWVARCTPRTGTPRTEGGSETGESAVANALTQEKGKKRLEAEKERIRADKKATLMVTRTEWEKQAQCGRGWHDQMDKGEMLDVDIEAPHQISYAEAECFDIFGPPPKPTARLKMKALMAIWTGPPTILCQVLWQNPVRMDLPPDPTPVKDVDGLAFKLVPPLPAGMNIKPDGSLQGVPQYQGTSEHTISVMHRDWVGQGSTKIQIEVTRANRGTAAALLAQRTRQRSEMGYGESTIISDAIQQQQKEVFDPASVVGDGADMDAVDDVLAKLQADLDAARGTLNTVATVKKKAEKQARFDAALQAQAEAASDSSLFSLPQRGGDEGEGITLEYTERVDRAETLFFKPFKEEIEASGVMHILKDPQNGDRPLLLWIGHNLKETNPCEDGFFNLKMPNVEMLDMKMPDVRRPELKMPEFKMPEFKMPKITNPFSENEEDATEGETAKEPPPPAKEQKPDNPLFLLSTEKLKDYICWTLDELGGEPYSVVYVHSEPQPGWEFLDDIQTLLPTKQRENMSRLTTVGVNFGLKMRISSMRPVRPDCSTSFGRTSSPAVHASGITTHGASGEICCLARRSTRPLSRLISTNDCSTASTA